MDMSFTFSLCIINELYLKARKYLQQEKAVSISHKKDAKAFLLI